MFTFLVKRLFQAVIVMFVISLVAFSIQDNLGDPLREMVGQRVTVRLSEAVPLTGGLMLELLEVEGKPLPQGGGRGKGKGPIRKRATQSRLAELKRAQKRKRVRRAK